MSVFEKLNSLNVNEKTENKNGLTYLSWTWAWQEFKKACPDATYEVVKFDKGLPYVYDENTGYMVYTKVTADNITHEMWLPVMDFNNNAMKSYPYEVKTKYKTMTVQPATMFDVNKAIMRCLTKNLAMFGLGLYIYAGEDLPESEAEAKTQTGTRQTIQQTQRQQQSQQRQQKQAQETPPLYPTDRQREDFMKRCAIHNVEAVEILKKAGWQETDGRMTVEHWSRAMFELNKLEEQRAKQKAKESA